MLIKLCSFTVSLPSHGRKVQFSDAPPKVHVMRVWSYAARQARAGHWERYALDRDRFKRRIADVEVAIAWVLKPQHRSRVMFQRFMPWRNAQKRKELAEKKERDAQEKLRTEEEALRAAEVEDQKAKAEEGDKSDVVLSGDGDVKISETNTVLVNGEVFQDDAKDKLNKAADISESTKVTEKMVKKKNIESNTVLVNGVIENDGKGADDTEFNKVSKKNTSKRDSTKTAIIPFNDKVFDLKAGFVNQAILDT